MSCSVKLDIQQDLISKNIINNSNTILNKSAFISLNDKYTKYAKDKYGILREDNLFSINNNKAISNEDFFNELDKIVYYNQDNSEEMKSLGFIEEQNFEFKKALSEFTDIGNSKIYNKVSFYNLEYNKIKPEVVETAEEKINKISKAFPGVKIIQDNLQNESAVVLSSNHPLSVQNNGPVIVINPNKLMEDTIFHEFGHIYIDMLGGLENDLVKDAIENLKDSELWSNVKSNYSELDGDNLSKEVLATALGIEGNNIYEDLEKENIWQGIKRKLLEFLSKLLNISNLTSIEKLASEIVTGKLQKTKSFNSLIDQYSKYKIENASQAEISSLFKELNNKFILDEETHEYVDESEDKRYKSSVSQFAKNISIKSYHRRKGSWDLEYDPTSHGLTKNNYIGTLNQAVLPYALDKALEEYFNNQIPGVQSAITPSENQYWHDFFKEHLRIPGGELNFVIPTLEDNLDVINERAQQIQDRKDIPREAGNRIHKILENYINGNTDIPGFIIDPNNKLESTIKEIIDTGKANGSIFFTEQVLFSEAAQKPGTADLIEITKDGKFKIYDFKTITSFRTQGRKKNDFELFIRPGYVNQVLIYSTILEEYGIKPADNFMNIVAIEVDTADTTLEDENSPIGIKDIINKNINPKDKAFFNHISRTRSRIYSYFKNPDKTSEFNLAKEENKINDLIAKIDRGMADYKKLEGKFSGETISESRMIKAISDDIKDLTETNNKTVILSYINNIREAMTSVFNSMQESDSLTSEYLANLDFLLQATSFLPDVKDYVLEEQEDFSINDKDKPELLILIDETSEIVRQVTERHRLKTKELAIITLATNSNFMEGKFAEKYELEAKQKGQDINTYVLEKIRERKDEIETAEYNYWQEVLKNGYTDIRYMEYLLADPGMNKSQFVQVVKNILDKVDQDVRTDLDREIADLVNWHEALTITKTGNPKKVWEKFLDEGTYTDYENKQNKFTRAQVIPEFTSEYREIYLKYKDQIDFISREINKLKKQNTKSSQDKVEFLISKRDDLLEKRKELLKDADKTLITHPKFKALNKEEQDALRFIHNKLERADDRLFAADRNKKLVTDLVGAGKIYTLPKIRKSYIEAAHEADKAWARFKSGLQEFISPRADEDEINITEDEQAQQDNVVYSSTDILGNPIYDVPIFYRNELEDPELQSFDIPTLLAMNDETTIMYQHHKMIEADLFNIVNALDPQKGGPNAVKSDSLLSNPVVDKLKDKMSKFRTSEDNLTVKAVKASIANRFYKRTYVGVYSKANYRLIKAGEALGKYTSATLLAGNFGSAAMTGIQGSIYRVIEGIAGEDFDTKDVMKGTRKAYADIHNILKDSQKQFPRSKTMLLIRRFGLETQYKALVNKFVQDNFITKNLDEGSIFAVTTIAETMVTANLMYTLMSNIKVMNEKGDYIDINGNVVKDKSKAMSLDEAYTVEDGKLVLHKDVAFTNMNLNSRFINNIEGEKTIAATEISRYIRSKYADLYGQYNQDMKSVAEMNVMGKLAFSMRKWIPRGYHRRFRGITSLNIPFDEVREDGNLAKRFYSQDQKKFQEGFYTTGIRFLKELYKEVHVNKLKLSAANSKIKSKMTKHELANLTRSLSELAIMISSFASALLLRSVVAHMDDDDKGKDKLYFAAYLVKRIQIESATFINPGELINNLKNPAASVNTLNRLGKLIDNLVGVSYDKETSSFDWEIDNEYERGNRKGELKLWRNIQNLVPFYKKYEQAKGILGLNSKESIQDSYEYMTR